VAVLNTAISNYTGFISMQRHNSNWGMHGVKYPDEFINRWEVGHYSEPEEVPCTTIDSFEFQDITLMKIDVELHEPFVLEGAQETLQRCKPTLMIEDCFNTYEHLLVGYGYKKIYEWPINMEYVYIWEK
jgi:FkbM family methyltransferase